MHQCAELGIKHDPLERVGEIAHLEVLMRAPRRQQRRLIVRCSRSVPTIPPVVVARLSRSTSSASGAERVCTRRICLLPSLSGGLDRDASVEAARPEQRRIENVGPG
jgi:hypothetical protein